MVQTKLASEVMKRECVITFGEKGELSLSKLAQLFSLINGIGWYLDEYIRSKKGAIELRQESSKTVWEFIRVGQINDDGTGSIETNAIVSHIQRRLIQYYLLHSPHERRSLKRSRLISEYFGNNNFNPSNFTYSITVESISYSSPLVIRIRSVTYLLIVLTFIGGGKFEVGLEGITVEMPGVERTIRAISESLFPVEDKEFRKKIIEIENTELQAEISDLIKYE